MISESIKEKLAALPDQKHSEISAKNQKKIENSEQENKNNNNTV